MTTGPGAPPPVDHGFLGNLHQGVQDFARGLDQEGLAGLLDPRGMLDRQDAQRDLAANFQIVAPGAARTADNQVTQAEYERIAGNYSDIRLDRTNMHFDTSDLNEADAAQYRRDAMGQMGRIMQTGTGRELIDGVAHNPLDHDMTFHTRRFPGGGLDTTNANAEPVHGETPASTPGVGDDVDMFINPGTDHYTISRPTDAWADQRGDVTMFHELTHAYHELHGTDDASGPVTAPGLGGSTRDADAGNVQAWEHQAVGLGTHAADTTPNENAYRRARAAIGTAGGTGIVTGDVGVAQRGDYSP